MAIDSQSDGYKKSLITSSADFEAEGLQHGVLRVPYSSHRSAYGFIPVPLWVSKRGEGPTVLLTGANHGDEYEGPVALMRLLHEGLFETVKGRVIVIPALNYPAYRTGTRTSPIDGANLNRVFPGERDGSVTEMLAHYIETVLMPMVEAEGGEFHIKVGGLRERRTYFAAKINGGFFNNRSALGLPNILGLILLSDGATGMPLAVMESGLITRLRTGAATAVAAKYLARPDSRTVTICGAGVQGEIQLRALKEVLPLERAFIWSRSGAQALAKRIQDELGIDAQPIDELTQATRQSEVIVTCTPSK